MGLAWIAPAVMVLAADGKRGRTAFKFGYVCGFAFHLGTLPWLLNIPVTGFPILGWILLSAFLALYQGTWMWMVQAVRQQLPTETAGSNSTWASRSGWALFGAAAWVAIEMAQARVFSGFPWHLVGASQYKLIPLIQIASITGIYGVSFVVVWFSLSLFAGGKMILEKPTARYAWLGEIVLPLVVVLALFVFGLGRVRTARDDARPTIRVTFVQPSIPQTMIWSQSEDETRFQQLIQLTTHALTNKPDLLLWPEAAVPKKIRYHDEMLLPIAELARSNRVWMIIGGDDAEPARQPRKPNEVAYFNASFLVSPDGELAQRYCKRNLVMFGEYIPLVRQLPFLTWFVPGSSEATGFSSGDGVVPFELQRREPNSLAAGATNQLRTDQKIRTAILICFEDVFPHLVPEYVNGQTDFLVNLTNDGWFGEGSEQWQHAAAAAFRAVENNIPLLRSCNNGLTCWIDSRGRMREIFRNSTGSVYGAGVMTAEIPVLAPGETNELTFYNRRGDWFGWACVVITIAMTISRLRLKSKFP